MGGLIVGFVRRENNRNYDLYHATQDIFNKCILSGTDYEERGDL